MSVNVGVTFVVYQGRSLTTWEPLWPSRQYHRIVSEPTNHAIGCARSTLRSLHTRGSCSPRNCLLSKNASSTLHLRQYPRITKTAETVASVETSASSRHWPNGSRISTTITGSVLLPLYQSTSRITCTRSSRACFGKGIVRSSAG